MTLLTSRVLKPYIDRNGPANICLLLDMMAAHCTLAVRQALSNLGITVLYVPGGLTGELQPLDIGLNGPFKHWIRERWAVTNGLGSDSPINRRIQLAHLIEYSWSLITNQTVINSFSHIYAYHGQRALETLNAQPQSIMEDEAIDVLLNIQSFY